jgi:glycosyltransferase involved in cell wall biosynthesis
MSEPLVSVFLPTYNQEEYIGEAIESALEQDYENIEIVIGDDHSQDGTWEIVTKYEREHPEKIVAFRNDENLGITGNCNQVLQRCSGKYIVFHAGDDVFLPNKINKQVKVLESNSNCNFCYHNSENFDSDTGERIERLNGHGEEIPRREDSISVARSILKQQNSFIPSVSVMLRNNTIARSGFDERVSVVSDWLMWVTYLIENGGDVVYIDEVLSRRRIHNSNASDNLPKFDTDQYIALGIVEANYPKLQTAVLDYRGYLAYRRSVEAIQSGDYQTGRRLMIAQLRNSVYSWKWIGWWCYSWLLQYYIIE